MSQEDVLKVLDSLKKATAEEIAKTLGVNSRAVRACLNRMEGEEVTRESIKVKYSRHCFVWIRIEDES